MGNKAIAVAVAMTAVLTACGDSREILTRRDRDARPPGRADSERRERPRHKKVLKQRPRHQRPKRERRPRVGKGSGLVTRGVTAYVSRVIDGDTIEVDLRGVETGVRLIGFDTPETVHPTEPVECFGKAASAYTTDRLAGRTVRLEFDVERADHYGRTLAYVWVADTLFNEEILRDGFAQVATYPPNVKYVDRFLGAQRRARDANRGLWSRCEEGGAGSVAGGGGSAPQKLSGGGKCDPNYAGACVPPYPPDIDCADVPAMDFRSKGSDPHGFDGDGDGIACES